MLIHVHITYGSFDYIKRIEYLSLRPFGAQSLTYSLSGSLQRKFADPMLKPYTLLLIVPWLSSEYIN